VCLLHAGHLREILPGDAQTNAGPPYTLGPWLKGYRWIINKLIYASFIHMDEGGVQESFAALVWLVQLLELLVAVFSLTISNS